MDAPFPLTGPGAERWERLPLAPPRAQPVLLTGATGYIGGRLARWLLARGWRLRCLSRSAAKLGARAWAADPRVEVLEDDLGDRDRLARAIEGCGSAYYLVHSMLSSGRAFARRDLDLAGNFGAAAAAAGLRRIIYLGGLGETGSGLSEHLSSRREVEHALAAAGVPVTTLRAAMILGSGSASFELLRYLVERLPLMVTPRWVDTRCQPIAVRNVLHYLAACLSSPGTMGATLDIGGPDVLSYRELIQTMAGCLGLRRRLVLALPVMTPRLSAAFIHLVTPIDLRVARPLAEGLRNQVVCRDDRAIRLMPQRLLPVREAIALALGRTASGTVETSWSDAGALAGDPDWAGGLMLSDQRSVPCRVSRGRLFAAVCRVGGDAGWYAGWLWRLRGLLDRLVGGPGLRRGRRHPSELALGDALDFWRVNAFDPGRRLELAAEMVLPGEARLEFVCQDDGSGSRLVQTARFRPRGLAGLAYWYLMAPLHAVIFPGMARSLARSAEEGVAERSAGSAPADS